MKKRPNGYWTLERCMEASSLYTTRTEFYKKNSGAYDAALKKGWIDTACAHMVRPVSKLLKWTLENCKTDALKYQSRKGWESNSGSAYAAAQSNGWLNICCNHMNKKLQSWSVDLCIKEALKYQSKTDWQNNDSKSYRAAVRKGILIECCKHMIEIKKPKNYWTLERCKKEALEYQSRSEWEFYSGSSCVAAFKNSWLEACCIHMKNYSSTSMPERKLLQVLKEKFPKIQTMKMAAKNFFINKPHIHRFDIDIYIPELRKGIEFNGDYWHSEAGLKRGRGHWPQEDIDNYHQLKKEFFKSRNIEYIEIWESDWSKDSQACIDRCLRFLNI